MLPFRSPLPRINSANATRKLWSKAMARCPPLIRTAPDHDGIALTDEAIGDPAAQDRREIHEAAIESEDLRRERLRRHRPEHAVQRRAKRDEARDVRDMARQQKLIDHVQHDQGGHPVVRKALPRLGGGQVVEPRGLPENAACGRARVANQRRRGDTHRLWVDSRLCEGMCVRGSCVDVQGWR